MSTKSASGAGPVPPSVGDTAPGTTAPPEPDFRLRFSHNVVEHLGLKLYQNRPTNVIAELVSNSWDADAAEARVEIQMGGTAVTHYISVADTGHGMSPAKIADSYLIIGQPKRHGTALNERTAGGRLMMGRKGIGKLAPFGIAGTIDVVSVYGAADGPRCSWFRLSAKDIIPDLSEAAASLHAMAETTTEYRPVVVAKGAEVSAVKLEEDGTGQVRQFLERISPGTGTLVLLRDLSIARRINPTTLGESLARRFTVALARTDFAVSVNGKCLEEESVLPKFELRIPPSGKEQDTVDGRSVSYWVGFVAIAEWPQDQAGIGIYAHGKIAQDRPFTFGVKGREIDTRYMYGVLEADWLDELPQDLISTDRTSVNWEHPALSKLYDWGQNAMRRWISQYRKAKEEREEDENKKRIKERILAKKVPKVTEAEQHSIARLISEVTPNLGKDEAAKVQLVDAVTQAWLHRPMRELVRKIWLELSKGDSVSPDALGSIVERLNEQQVPESLSLAVTFAQRTYALSLLYDLVHRGREPDLQKLVERFPWIIGAEFEMLTANETLKTVVEKARREGLLDAGRRTTRVAGVPEGVRPDFVFLSKLDNSEILVVELKSPREDLTIENREQLHDYMTFLEMRYPDSAIRGILIGTIGGKIEPVRRNMTVSPWTSILTRSRHSHIEMLGSMLLGAGPSADDARMREVVEFGGAKTIELLNSLAESNPELRELMEELDSLKEEDAAKVGAD